MGKSYSLKFVGFVGRGEVRRGVGCVEVAPGGGLCFYG